MSDAVASQNRLLETDGRINNMIKRFIIALFAMGLLAIASTGCNTVHGAGEDIEHAGDKIQENTPP